MGYPAPTPVRMHIAIDEGLVGADVAGEVVSVAERRSEGALMISVVARAGWVLVGEPLL